MQVNPLSRANSRINFTKRTIDELIPPATGRTYVYDVATPGLALCITATGSKTFYSYRKVNGRPERVKIGRWPAWTVERARDEALSIAGRGVDGATPNDSKRAERGLPTFGEMFELFILEPTRTRAKRPKSAKTVEGYRYQFATFLTNWKERRLSDISRDDVERLHAKLGQDHGSYMANRVLSLVRAVFNLAIDKRHPVTNPAARLRPFAEHSRERFLQADELPKFWAALDSEPSDKVRDFIRFALFSGQRRGNVLSMKWADIDMERGVWTIPQTKTGRHQVPLSQPAMDILRRRFAAKDSSGPLDKATGLHGPSEYVFPGLHGSGYLKDPMRQWRGVLKRAGIADLRIHDLRRSLGSWQTATGANTAIVGKTLGHSRPETTAIYSRVTENTVRQSVDVAAAAILAAAQPVTPAAKSKGKRKGGAADAQE
jgi:integrase